MHLQRAVVVAVGVPNATKVSLPLNDLEGDAPFLHAFGSDTAYYSTSNDGDIDVAPGHCPGLLWGHHLAVYTGLSLPHTGVCFPIRFMRIVGDTFCHLHLLKASYTSIN